MKWQQRVRVATGLSCWQIMLHLLVVALLVVATTEIYTLSLHDALPI